MAKAVRRLIPPCGDRNPFHGIKPAIRAGAVRGAMQSIGAARRNAPDGRFHATEGRVLLAQCGVALRLKCWALLRKARLALRQNNPGEMGPYHRKVVLAKGNLFR